MPDTGKVRLIVKEVSIDGHGQPVVHFGWYDGETEVAADFMMTDESHAAGIRGLLNRTPDVLI